MNGKLIIIIEEHQNKNNVDSYPDDTKPSDLKFE